MADEGNSHASLIRSLESRIASLEADNKKLSDEAAKRRHVAKELRSQLEAVMRERDEALDGFTALEEEHTALTERANAAPEAKDQRIADLEQTIRTMNHKESFSKAAKAAGVREDALGDLWDLSGYKAETDQADEAKLSELITAKLKGRDYLLAPKVETTTAAADAAQPNQTPTTVASAAITTPASKPGPGAVRTTSDTSAPAVQTVQDRVARDFAAFYQPGKQDGRL